ncbi:helicase-exonuclease AddAB subunit AddA [Butyrivibrio proteoclasticus]|uniref:helicase-exonuclease AddAB subunit AddA n=1 Tax=Butyrivibrio proteoclasticus TaxID=43305 RepID=UPI000478CA6B|nr:helicase-exonuclease AddAB subunit AddA [Butyrivibrio proteoclasticus]
MAVKFTKEQQSVIDSRKQNILVSAAAGSGKTAVLVERIIQMISENVDIDHLLVVTFTKAAASQMKEKITLAIQDKLLEDPDNKHLQKQETLVHNAQITTIDSFCQYIIKNNFNSIGLDPSFRVGDEGEFRLLQEDVMNELLEAEYEKAKTGENDDFLYTMEYFGTGSNDKKVAEYIYQLFRFSMSMPWPEDWINERSRDYSLEGADFEQLYWVKACVSDTIRKLKDCFNKLENAEKICCEPDGPYMYGDLIEKEKDMIEALLSLNSYDQLFDRIRSISFDRLPTKKDDSVNPSKREYAKNLRTTVKDEIKDLIETYYALPSDVIIDQMVLCDRAVKELCNLTIKFKRAFEDKKKEMRLIDFSDMEHYALNILVNHPSEEECQGLSSQEIMEKCTPSSVALEYRDFFKEVLIDEYQDSNNVQELILKAISGEDVERSERFMVGDVKQSIYKFRLARPEIFMDKLVSFNKDPDSKDRRIDLHMNFRSRKEVLEGTNYIFEKIMDTDLGSVAYDEDARLVTGATYEEPAFDMSPELLLVEAEGDSEELSDYTAKEKEALVIAGKIAELRHKNPDLKYKDIVILLRANTGWDDVFKKILGKQGIPAYIESKSGYYEAFEVDFIVNLLSIIDNPMQDIPLVAIMHSFIGGFDDEELARIRIAINQDESILKVEPFYACLKKVDLDEDLVDKRDKFVAFVDNLRQMSTYTSVHGIIQYVIQETGFDAYVAAMPGGEQRKANLDLLLNKALSFEKSSFKGLFHFVRYIEHVKFIQVDQGEAGTIDENADVVRIMSIHKSKGLEFPVVFVAGLSKGFNKMDTQGDLITDMDLGIGVRCIDSKLRVKYDTLKRLIIADKMVMDCLGEELRVLYVALTRAKEKLYLTACFKDVATTVDKALKEIALIAANTVLPYSIRSGAHSYLDLLLPSLMRHPNFGKLVKELSIDGTDYEKYKDRAETVPAFDFDFYDDNKILTMELKKATAGQLRRADLTDHIDGRVDPELKERLKEKFSAKYPYDNLQGLFTKTTVSELKKQALEEEGEHFTAEIVDFAGDREKPDYEPSGRLSGPERGTAYHRVMELLDEKIYGNPNVTVTQVRDWIKEKADEKVIPEEYYDSIYAKDIITFLSTDLGKRMGQALLTGNLMREKPFMMGVSARDLNEKFPEDEMVLVQGIIDAWFLEGDDIVLMDYKTDKVKEDKELIDRYKVQLDYYKKALESATQKKVKEVYIYSFTLGKEIKLAP